MRLVFIISVFFSVQSNLMAQNEGFQNLLNLCKVDYRISPLFNEIPKLQSSKITFDYSLQHIDSNFFVLYAIIPYENSATLNENKLKSSNEVGYEVEQRLLNFQKIVFDIFDDEYLDYNLFDSLAVKSEFNADWGVSASFKLKDNSFNGFKECTMLVLNKKEVGDILIYYISDKRENFNEMMSAVFYSLRFR